MEMFGERTDAHRRALIAAALTQTPPDALVAEAGGGAAPAALASALGIAFPSAPPDWPAEIAIQPCAYVNWSLQIADASQWTAQPHSANDVATIATWAAGHNYKVRALGSHHNWSPLVLENGAPPEGNTVLVDTSGLKGKPVFTRGNPCTVTFGAGTTLEEATQFLESLDNGGASAAPGYSFLNMPAPGIITVGGMMAVGAHGTGVPIDSVVEPDLNGSISNLVTAFTAVVTETSAPGSYTLKTFTRADAESAAFLVHLGRAFVTDVTLAVVPNYYLQVVNWYPEATTLFEAPSSNPSQDSLAAYLDRYGRLEVIWFPFTENPWLKTWERKAEKIEPQVSGPYNYPWANSISLLESSILCTGLRIYPPGAKLFGLFGLSEAQGHAPHDDVMNGTARDLLLYVNDTTLRYGACGYAVQIRRADVQRVANAFYTQFNAMVAAYEQKGLYPVNGPVEIRYTTVDRTNALNIAGALPPALAASSPVDPADAGLDTVFWVDILTVPDTPASGQFFVEFEQWLGTTFGAGNVATQRPEWSKGWAYTAGGGWSDVNAITKTIPGYYNQPPVGSNSYDFAQKVLAKYDASNIYTNTFLDKLLPK